MNSLVARFGLLRSSIQHQSTRLIVVLGIPLYGHHIRYNSSLPSYNCTATRSSLLQRGRGCQNFKFTTSERPGTSGDDSKAREELKEAIRELSEGRSQILSHPPVDVLVELSSKPLSDLSMGQLEELARAYFEGIDDFKQNEAKAVEVWEEAMGRGSVEASYSYAVCLREGRGIHRDTAKAFQIFSELAEREYPLACYSAGILLSVGEGCEKDDVKAYERFKAAALGGVTPAMHNMGNAYANGAGVPQSDTNALKFYEAAVEAGDPSSKFTLGVWYSKGRGNLPVDKKRSFELQLEAAESGHPLAMFNTGVSYMQAEVVEQDFVEAAKWFQLAADLKLVAAAVNLAMLYKTGTGVPKDLQKARSLILPHKDADDVCRELIAAIENELLGDVSTS